MGKRRQDALRAFANRTRVAETSSFSRTLIQADKMGTGLNEALVVLAEDMRLKRYHWAERVAQQAPIKMLLPLMMSLGASMLIIAGPIFLQFMRGDMFGGVGSPSVPVGESQGLGGQAGEASLGGAEGSMNEASPDGG